MDDFDKVRWKTADQLTDTEAQLIVDNKDKLNDEEKAAFSDLLLQAEPLPADPLAQALDNTEGNTTPDPVVPITPPDPATPIPTTPAAEPLTKELLDGYLENKRKEWDAEGKTKAQQKKEEDQIKFDLFKQGEIPADWNDAVNKFAPAIIEATEKRILARLDKQNKEFAENQERIKSTQEEIYQRFEGEFAALAKSNLIPDPKTDPEGYKKVRDGILAIGNEHGKSTVTDAYKLWSIIPEDKGGGLAVGSSAGAPADPKAKIEAQKQAAGAIRSGRGAVGDKKGGPLPWNTVHSSNIEDLIEQRLRQP